MIILQVNWHDFAFFDPVMYESLRQLILASQSSDADAVFSAMDLAFAVDLCKEEGGGQVKQTQFSDLRERIGLFVRQIQDSLGQEPREKD